MTMRDVAERPLFNADGSINADAARNNPQMMARARATIETMFYAGDEPWHGLGTAVASAVTSEEAIRLAGLDWDVALGQVWAGPRQELVEGRYSVYRVTDGKVLGITMGKQYKPIHNRDGFAFLDSLVKDRRLRFSRAGSLFGGKKVWILAELDEDMRIAGDTYYPYLLVVTTHDGTNAFRAFPTLVRAECNNTVMQAVGASKRGGAVAAMVLHSGNVQAKLEAASAVMQVTTNSMLRYQQWLESLTKVSVSDEQFDTVQEAMFGKLDDQTPTLRQKAIATFQAIYEAEQALHDSTAYSLVQAVTGYADHGTHIRSSVQYPGEGRMAAQLGGSIYYNKGKALNLVQGILDIKGIEFSTAGA